MTLTPEAIFALAPDGGSAANGRKLAIPSKWQNLNAPGGLLWGQCQGSGKDPYLVGVDLGGLVSKCSCPSRKFPCKHGLALMLLHASHTEQFGQAEAPESLQTWLKGRAQRAEQKEQKTEDSARKEADPTAQAKRRLAREKKVTDGLAALHTFLKDLVRDGLAQAASRPYSDWDTQAARLTDAQAPGAARLVRQIPEKLSDPAALFTHLGKLALLCEGWLHRHALTDSELADLRTTIGFPLDQAGLLDQEGLSARWNVLGQTHVQEDHLIIRRTWLQQAQQTALLLDFAPAGRPLPPGLSVGQSVQAELCYAPSAAPQRAVLKGEAAAHGPLTPLAAPLSLDGLLDTHATALAANPWLERSAHLIGPLRIAPGTPWSVVDAEGHELSLGGGEQVLLHLLALGGGQPLTLYGEWDGLHILPLSLLGSAGLIPLTRWGEA